MSHDSHTTDRSIREIAIDGISISEFRQMSHGWVDPFPAPVVDKVAMDDGRTINVVRDDLCGVGSKGRFGSLLFQRTEQNTLVYVAPRVGWAAISLAKLAAMYDKRLILFAAACKTPSLHQQVAMELGAEMRFYRVAALPNLQARAEKFAKKHGYVFLPLGLRHPLVTAAVMATAQKLAIEHEYPKQVWTAVSTGVLSRGLQLAWPRAEVHGVAVARNIKAGERGRAILHSHPFAFTVDERLEFRPPFPSATNYDAKVWRYIVANAIDGAWFWNVAGEIQPSKLLPDPWTKSNVQWGDDQAFVRR